MGYITITSGFNPGDVPAMCTKIDEAYVFIQPNEFSLTPEERRTKQKLGPLSYDFKDLMLQIAEDFPNTVPKDLDIVEIQMLAQYFDDLTHIKTHKAQMDQLVDDLILCVGVQLMSRLNRIYNNALQMTGKGGSTPLGKRLEVAGRKYERPKRTPPPEFMVPAGSELSVPKVRTGSLFTNTGTTVLKLCAGSDLSSKLKVLQPITVNPGSSAKVPAGYSTILVKNMSASDGGSFTVRLRS